MGSSVKRYLGSSLLWNFVLSVFPMFMLIIFIIILNNQSSDEESLRTETTLSHSVRALEKNFEIFFAMKLKFYGAMEHMIKNGVWTDPTDIETFTNYALPAMNAHSSFRAIMVHQNDGSFLAAIREGQPLGVTAKSLPINRNILMMASVVGAENGDLINMTEAPHMPVVRRHMVPPHLSNAADHAESYFNHWKYVLPLPSDISTQMPSNLKIDAVSDATSWYDMVQIGSHILRVDPSTSQFYYAAKVELGESSKRGLEKPATFSTRVSLNTNIIGKLFTRPAGVDLAIVRVSDWTILYDTRGNTFPFVATPPGQTLGHGSDSLFGVARNLANTTVHYWHGVNQIMQGLRPVSGVQLRINGSRSDFALLVADAPGASPLSAANLFSALVSDMESVFSRLLSIGEGTDQMFRSRTVSDLGDPGQTSRLLVPYFYGLNSFVEELLVCQGNSTVPVSGGSMLIVHPCYQVKNRFDDFIDVAWWPGNVSNIARVYNLIQPNAVNHWHYSPHAKVNNVIQQTGKAMQLPADTPLSYSIPILEAPFYFEGDTVLAMPICVVWPTTPHGGEIEIKEGHPFWNPNGSLLKKPNTLNSCFRFVFEINELQKILIDADLHKEHVAGAAAIVFSDGTIITSTVEGWKDGANIIDSEFGFVGLKREQFEYLRDHPNKRFLVDDTSNDYVQLIRVWDASGSGGIGRGSVYLFMVLPMLVGEVEESIKETKYYVDGLVALAFFIFSFHCVHFILGYRTLRQVRKALLAAANLSISPADQRQLRLQGCCSNSDMDSLQEHAFFAVDTINQHKSYLDSNVRETLAHQQNAQQQLEFDLPPEVSAKAKKALNTGLNEKSVVLLACYFPNLDTIQKAGVKVLPEFQNLEGTDGKWYRTSPVSNGTHPTALSASAYWLPEESPDTRVVDVESAALRKAWSVGSRWVSALERYKIKDCIITLSAGRSFVGNMGPIPPEGATQFFKRFVIQGFVRQHSLSLFDMLGKQQAEVVRSGGSNPSCCFVTDMDHARQVGASNTTSLNLRKEKLGELVLWFPEAQTPLTQRATGGGFSNDGI